MGSAPVIGPDAHDTVMGIGLATGDIDTVVF